MKIISNKKKLIKIIKREKNLGFIPTMGAIHKAHISMLKKCNNLCNKSILSIFINKQQFNRKEDYKKYPRILKKDISILNRNGLDYLYLPNVKQIYPSGPNKKIKVSGLSKKLCGKFRPGHFKAVVDVVDRFIKIIKPSKIFLGEKDMQQLKIIEDFIKKNKIKVKVIPCKIVREKSGLAYSSRNFFLSQRERKIASHIYKMLINKKQLLIKKKISLSEFKKKLSSLGVNRIDYIKILDINKMAPSLKKIETYKIFIAYYLGSTRLIDNV